MFYFSPAAVWSLGGKGCCCWNASGALLGKFHFTMQESSFSGPGLFCDVTQSIVKGRERRWWDKHLPGVVQLQLVLSRAGEVAGGGDQERRNLREGNKWFLDVFSGLSSLIFKFWGFSKHHGKEVFLLSEFSFLCSLSCAFIVAGHSSSPGILISLGNPSWTLLRWFICRHLACYGDDCLAVPNPERNTFQARKMFLQNNKIISPKTPG